MNLRNGKLKPDYIDLDDYDSDDYMSRNKQIELAVKRYNTRNQLVKVKMELISDLDTDDEHTTHLPKHRHTISAASSWTNFKPVCLLESVDNFQVKIEPIDDKLLSIDKNPVENVEQITKVQATVKEHKRPNRQKLNQPIVSLKNSKEFPTKRYYECYVCGKRFPHLCRVRSHMPSHSGLKLFHCKLCPKKYANASSLNVHNRIHHLGEKRKRKSWKRSKSMAMVDSNQMPIIKIEYPTPQPTPNDVEFNQIFDFNVGSMEFDDVEMPIIDYTPFIWDDTDLNLEIEQTAMPHISMDISKVSHKDNHVTPIATNLTINLQLWQKESNKPLAWLVDIFKQLKPMRSLFDNNDQKELMTSKEMNVKNNETANEHREIGDIEFMQRNWYEAREWYNRSICHAKFGTVQLAIGYAKRAQCFFNLGMYKQCWIDLMMAEKNVLPEHLMPQLVKHKQTCLIMMQKIGPQFEVEPKLSFAADPHFPEMANVLQIVFNETFGRHIIAKEAIDAGNIVLIEKGFVSTTTEFYGKCCICLAIDTNLVPCPKCCNAMLCKRCIDRKFHKIECDLQSNGDNNPNTNQWIIKVVRSILSAIAIFANIDELMNFVIATVNNDRPIPDTITDLKSKYGAFLQLINRPTLKTDTITLAKTIQMAFLNHDIIGRFFTSIKYQRFLSHLILHHIEVIRNFSTKTNEKNDSGFIEITAPIASYLHHSCAPNVSKFLLGNSIILVTMRPIAKGQQLLVCYCNVLASKKERQDTLMDKYGFQCMCERCIQPDETNPIQPIDYFKFYAEETFFKENFTYLASNDQKIRKELSERVLDILQHSGYMPWNYTVNWSYVVYSLLLSRRFQQKLQY